MMLVVAQGAVVAVGVGDVVAAQMAAPPRAAERAAAVARRWRRQ